MSPRSPPKISYKDNWMKDLDSDIAGSSKDIQRIEPKPNTQLSRTGRLVCGKLQCSHCLLHWNQGILHCTCGQFLVESASRRKIDKLRLDALSIPHHVIKKGRCHGDRHGKTEEPKENHEAWNAWMRCCKKVDSQGEYFTSIHDGFLRDPVYRESQLAIGWTEQKCIEWDELAKEDHTDKLTPEERRRYEGQRYLTLNKEGKNGPLKLRSDFRAAVLMKNRLHHESGEQIEDRLHPDQQRRWHSFQAHRGGTSLNGIGSELTKKFIAGISFLLQQSIAIHCNRRDM